MYLANVSSWLTFPAINYLSMEDAIPVDVWDDLLGTEIRKRIDFC